MRTIKKYPNRRLYDTEVSRYITVSDLRQLIIEGEEFEVVDVASGDDLTRMVLLQMACSCSTVGSTSESQMAWRFCWTKARKHKIARADNHLL